MLRVASGNLVLFIVACKGRIFPYAHYSRERAMKNNRGGCLGCLNGRYATVGPRSPYYFQYFARGPRVIIQSSSITTLWPVANLLLDDNRGIYVCNNPPCGVVVLNELYGLYKGLRVKKSTHQIDSSSLYMRLLLSHGRNERLTSRDRTD